MQNEREGGQRDEWEAAPGHVAAAAARMRREIVVIGVTGPVGAGKSLLASRLSACVVRTDDYLPDYERIAYQDRDRPEHADLARLARDLEALCQGRAVQAPVWSFHTHRREGERRIEPGPIVVCEGIHALEDAVLAQLDIRVFVEAPAAVRWGRWEELEQSGQRGWGVAAAREYFDRVAEPTFAAAADRYRRAADFIVLNAGDQSGGEKQLSQRGS